jgi:lipid A 3-O-deacylase
LAKKLLLSFLSVLFFLITTKVNSQKQINLDVDNDLYFNRDFYYSSGIFLSYFKPVKDNVEDHNRLTLGQLIYTPSMRYESNPEKYDYPYSGYLFLEYQKRKKMSSHSSYSLGGQIGITGNASLAKGMQNLYHDLVLNLPNLKWESQMPQELQFNLLASYFKGFKIKDNLNLTSELYSKLGTYQIMSGLEMGLYIGDLSWLGFSDNYILNTDSEFSFFIGTKLEYFIHDFKLEGSLLNDKAELVMESNDFRDIFSVGLKKRFNNIQVLTSYNSTSKDTKNQRTKRHPFLKISITYILN